MTPDELDDCFLVRDEAGEVIGRIRPPESDGPPVVDRRKPRTTKPATTDAAPQESPPEPPPPESPPKRKGGLSLASLRESTDYREKAAARRIQLVVPVKKPGPHDFHRVRPGAQHRIDQIRLFVTEDKTFYAVDETVRDQLEEYLQPCMIVVVANRTNTVSLWPLRLPQDEDNRAASWYRSAIRAAERMETEWLKIVADMAAGGYTVTRPADQFPEPTWPEDSLQELVDRAFAHHLIDSLDHPEIKRIQGRL